MRCDCCDAVAAGRAGPVPSVLRDFQRCWPGAGHARLSCKLAGETLLLITFGEKSAGIGCNDRMKLIIPLLVPFKQPGIDQGIEQMDVQTRLVQAHNLLFGKRRGRHRQGLNKAGQGLF